MSKIWGVGRICAGCHKIIQPDEEICVVNDEWYCANCYRISSAGEEEKMLSDIERMIKEYEQQKGR